MDDNQQQPKDVSNDVSLEKQQPEKKSFDFLKDLTDEDKQQLAQELGARYLEENKSLRKYKTQIQLEKEEAEKRRLEEEGKYKELSQKHLEKVKAYKSKLATNSLKEILLEKGVSKGILNLTIQAYKDKLEVDEEDNISNLDNIIQELEVKSPEIFTKPKGGFTLPANPSQPLSTKKVPFSSLSSLSTKEVAELQKEGRIDYSK